MTLWFDPILRIRLAAVATARLQREFSAGIAALCLGLQIVLIPLTAPEAREKPDRITPGARVRVDAPASAGSRVVGTVVSVDSIGMLLLPVRKGRDRAAPSTTTVTWAEIHRLDMSQRQWSFARTVSGAGIGLLGGAVAGGLIGLALDDPSSEYYGVGVLAGAIVFGGIGLVSGTLIGAIPHGQWTPVSLDRDRPGFVDHLHGGHLTSNGWSSDLSVGYAQGRGDEFGPGSVSAVVDGFYASGAIGLGLEGGYHALGTESTYYGNTSKSAWQTTLAFRVRRPRGSLRPYGVLGVGTYFLRDHDEHAHGVTSHTWESTQVSPGFNIGFGAVHHRTLGAVSLGMDVRWHGTFDGSFLTTSVLARLGQ